MCSPSYEQFSTRIKNASRTIAIRPDARDQGNWTMVLPTRWYRGWRKTLPCFDRLSRQRDGEMPYASGTNALDTEVGNTIVQLHSPFCSG